MPNPFENIVCWSIRNSQAGNWLVPWFSGFFVDLGGGFNFYCAPWKNDVNFDEYVSTACTN